jgi:hypothetical protein
VHRDDGDPTEACERSIKMGDKSPKNTQKQNKQKEAKKTPKK